MRTEADLQLAFGLLEREVDEYLSARVAPSEPVALIPSPRRHRRRPVIALAAAAVTVLLTLASVVTYRAFTTADVPAGGQLPVRSLSFSLRPVPGVRIVEALVEGRWYPGGAREEAHYLAPDGHYRIDIARQSWIETGLPAASRAVDVNGVPATLGCLGRPAPTLARCTSLGVEWRYAPGLWVSVSADGSHGSQSTLLRIARAVDLGHPQRLTSPVRLDRAPAGMTLFSMDIIYGVADPPARKFEPRPQVGFSYAVAGRERVVVWASPGSPLDPMPGSRSVTVAGRRGYWDAKHRGLTYDAGRATTVGIGWANGAGSLTDALKIAATITVVDHPDRLSSWPSAHDALP